MRPRDVRAISFCVVTTLALVALALFFTRNMLVAAALVAAWLTFVLTRPRMQRVIRRLRGEPDWGGYFKND